MTGKRLLTLVVAVHADVKCCLCRPGSRQETSLCAANRNLVRRFSRRYWQGEPTDRLPIWRYGRYQVNDPNNRIRS
jgi:hypothetical protein